MEKRLLDVEKAVIRTEEHITQLIKSMENMNIAVIEMGKSVAIFAGVNSRCDKLEKDINILAERLRQTDRTMNKLSAVHTESCNDKHDESVKQSTNQLRWVVGILVAVIGSAFVYMSSIKEVVIRIDKTVGENKLSIGHNKDALKRANGHRYYLKEEVKAEL